MTDNRTTERVDHPPRVRGAIDEFMREKDAADNRTTELLPCPFCGGEAEVIEADYGMYMTGYAVYCRKCCLKLGVTGRLGETYEWSPIFDTEAEAIAAWNSRAAMEFDNWFYLPKPKEPIVEATETTHAWDGTKVKTDVLYQVQEQAVINWAKELDEHIIKRICEVWNTRVERTCEIVSSYLNDFTSKHECWYEFEMQCGYRFTWDEMEPPNHCPNCGGEVREKAGNE